MSFNDVVAIACMTVATVVCIVEAKRADRAAARVIQRHVDAALGDEETRR